MQTIEVANKESAVWYAIPVSMTSGGWSDLDIWCTDNFGQGMTGMKDFPKMQDWPEDQGRWGLFYGRIFFRYKEDMLMFMLRWS